MPGVPRHFALLASTLYHFAGDWPWQNPHFPDHFMGCPWHIHKACPALLGNSASRVVLALKAPFNSSATAMPDKGALHGMPPLWEHPHAQSHLMFLKMRRTNMDDPKYPTAPHMVPRPKQNMAV